MWPAYTQRCGLRALTSLNAAALIGLGALFIDFNRRIFLKAFDILGIPHFKIVWKNETKDEEDEEEYVVKVEEEDECGHD